MDTASGVIIDALNEIKNECRTTTALAELLGISQSGAWMVLNGQRPPGVKILKGLVQYSTETALAVWLFLTDGDLELIARIAKHLNNGDKHGTYPQRHSKS